MEVEIKKSTRKGKKLVAIFYENGKKIKTTHFGSLPNKDYTIYNKIDGKKIADEKKKLYLARHNPNVTKERWDLPKTSGALSRWILWNKRNLNDSIKDYVKRFKLKLKK